MVYYDQSMTKKVWLSFRTSFAQGREGDRSNKRADKRQNLTETRNGFFFFFCFPAFICALAVFSGMAAPLRAIALAEVQQHTSPTDAWIVIAGKVYDVTKFLDSHPGGVEVLMSVAGRKILLHAEVLKPHFIFLRQARTLQGRSTTSATPTRPLTLCCPNSMPQNIVF